MRAHMTMTDRPWWSQLFRTAWAVFWMAIVLLVLRQLSEPSRIAAAREAALDAFQEARHSRVIAMIHREETVSIFGVPVSSSIDIEDSEAILRAIRLTPPEQPIDLILHTPGGLVLAAEQIAHSLIERKGKVTVFVPHYAMSGGTLLALTADEIVMDPNAVLGPVDPQIGDLPAASIVKLLELKPAPDQRRDAHPRRHRDQGPAASRDVCRRYRVEAPAQGASHRARKRAQRGTLDARFSNHGGRGAGTRPASLHEHAARCYALMDLYPQAGEGRPSVMYVPLKRPPPDGPHEDQAPASK